MNLSISNLAWPVEADDEVLAILPQAGFGGLEVAPTKLWSAPAAATARELDAYRRKVEGYGLQVVALQSLLFGKPELQLFGDDASRRALEDYLGQMIRIAVGLGAGSLVFGSPKNRLRGELPEDDANEIAVRFFRDVGRTAHANGVELVLEANPKEYGADFLTGADDAIAFVKAVDSPGIGLHLCAGCMRLAGDDPGTAVDAGEDRLRHVHVSEPFLAPIENGASEHVSFATALREVGYRRWVSVEMRPPEPFSVEALLRSLAYTRDVYGPPGS